jgi:hypothetical protein
MGLPARLDDDTLARVEAFAASPLAPLPDCDDDHFAKCFRVIALLPRRQADEVKGELQFGVYRKILAGWPGAAMSFLTETAARECKFFPTTNECLSILRRWERGDAQARSIARTIAGREWQARFGEAMRAMQYGDLDQAAIDALPEEWRKAGEAKGYLRALFDLETGTVNYLRRESPYARPEDQAA